MTSVIKRACNGNLTEVVLLDNDGLYKVFVEKYRFSESYEKYFTYIGDAFDFYDWALENE